MTMSTGEANFDQDDAERLLQAIEPTTLRKAHDELRGSCIALVEGRRRPGRAFRYQDSCVKKSIISPSILDAEFRQNALIYGPLPNTMYKDADELEGDLCAGEDWLDWPLTGSNGSVAALVAMISDMKVSRFLVL